MRDMGFFAGKNTSCNNWFFWAKPAYESLIYFYIRIALYTEDRNKVKHCL